MNNVITINGKDYAPEDMNEQQTYLINQIRSCQQKAANIRFELDQVQAAQNVWRHGVKTGSFEKTCSQMGQVRYISDSDSSCSDIVATTAMSWRGERGVETADRLMAHCRAQPAQRRFAPRQSGKKRRGCKS